MCSIVPNFLASLGACSFNSWVISSLSALVTLGPFFFRRRGRWRGRGRRRRRGGGRGRRGRGGRRRGRWRRVKPRAQHSSAPYYYPNHLLLSNKQTKMPPCRLVRRLSFSRERNSPGLICLLVSPFCPSLVFFFSFQSLRIYRQTRMIGPSAPTSKQFWMIKRFVSS